jgi:hypothetical protein
MYGGRALSKEIICGKLYASWCHYCKDLQQPWQQLLDILSKDMVCVNKEVALGDKDESQHDAILSILTKQLGARQKIQVQNGYPTIFKLDNYKNVVYHKGARTLEELHKFFTGKHLGRNPGYKKRVRKQSGGCGWLWPRSRRSGRKAGTRRRSARKF